VLNLVAATALLQVVTGSPVSSIEVHASYSDRLGEGPTATVTPDGKNTVIGSAATTTVVAAAQNGAVRNVKFLSVLNSSGSPCTVTVQHFDGTNTSALFGPISLLAGYALHNDSDGRGFVLYDNLGNIL
jgi:hypothetical protein